MFLWRTFTNKSSKPLMFSSLLQSLVLGGINPARQGPCFSWTWGLICIPMWIVKPQVLDLKGLCLGPSLPWLPWCHLSHHTGLGFPISFWDLRISYSLLYSYDLMKFPFTNFLPQLHIFTIVVHYSVSLCICRRITLSLYSTLAGTPHAICMLSWCK